MEFKLIHVSKWGPGSQWFKWVLCINEQWHGALLLVHVMVSRLLNTNVLFPTPMDAFGQASVRFNSKYKYFFKRKRSWNRRIHAILFMSKKNINRSEVEREMKEGLWTHKKFDPVVIKRVEMSSPRDSAGTRVNLGIYMDKQQKIPSNRLYK